jgi:hypothetical protein
MFLINTPHNAAALALCCSAVIGSVGAARAAGPAPSKPAVTGAAAAVTVAPRTPSAGLCSRVNIAPLVHIPRHTHLVGQPGKRPRRQAF